MLPFLTLFGRSLPLYWLMALAGALAAWLYAWLTNRGGKAGHVPGVDLLHIFLLAVVGALVGAKVLAILTQLPLVLQNWDRVVAQPSLLIPLFTTGMVFYGGLLGGAAAVYWYCKKYAIPLDDVLGVMTPAVPLFHVFGRIGCFLGGCCWGIEVPWGIAFSHSQGAPNGVPYLPIQLIEAGCNLLLFVALAALSRRLVQKWRVLPIYLISYGVLRFVLEIFRGDAGRGGWLLSTSQWISLVLAGLSVVWLARRRQTRAGTGAVANP